MIHRFPIKSEKSDWLKIYGTNTLHACSENGVLPGVKIHAADQKEHSQSGEDNARHPNRVYAKSLEISFSSSDVMPAYKG